MILYWTYYFRLIFLQKSPNRTPWSELPNPEEYIVTIWNDYKKIFKSFKLIFIGFKSAKLTTNVMKTFLQMVNFLTNIYSLLNAAYAIG
jgi:hypothetical protein